MDPVHYVVRGAPFRRPIASSRPPAVTVAGVERATRRPGDSPLGAADVDDRGVGTEKDAGDRAVAGQSLHCLRRDRQRELHLRRRRAGETEKSLQRSRDLKLRAVQRVHRELDQRIRQPPRIATTVVLSRSLGQRLQCCAQRRTPDLVEHAADRDHAVIGIGQGQLPHLDALNLFLDDPRGVSRMPGVDAGLAELGHAFLARMAQEGGLVEAFADLRRGVGDMRKVCKSNLTGLHRRHALVQSLQLLAGTDTRGNGTAGHVAHRLDTGEGTYEALSVVLVGLGEPGRDHRPNQLVLVHLDPTTDEIIDHLGAAFERKSPLPTFHASHYTNIRL